MVVRADGKDELSGWEALADVFFGNRLVGRVSLAERGTWKVRLSGCGALATSDWFRDRRVGRVSLVEQQV